MPSGDAAVMPGGAPGGGSYFGGVTAGSQDEWQSISTTVSLQAGDAVGAAALFYNAEVPEEGYCDDVAEVVVMLDGNVVARSSPRTRARPASAASARGAAARST